jgi:trehalose 6-phosphate synthase/phosphatase
MVLFQVCLPEQVAEDKEAEASVNELVNSINSQFGTLSYTPIHFHQRDLGEEEYFALLCRANYYLNTAERDSIPSPCLDYIICQEHGRTSGALIVSDFTAIADILPGVITVNPWHTVVPPII